MTRIACSTSTFFYAIQIVFIVLHSVVEELGIPRKIIRSHSIAVIATRAAARFPLYTQRTAHALSASRVQKHARSPSHLIRLPSSLGMQGLFIDASHPIMTALRLACSEPLVWLHDGLPDGSEHLLFLVTLWHVCSLLQPDVDLLFQHASASVIEDVNATRHASLARHTLPVDGRFKPPSGSLLDSGSDVVKGLVGAWPAHPLHVAVLTSPGDPLRVRLWLCDDTVDSDSDSEAQARGRTRAVDVQDTGGGGRESTGAWGFGPDVIDDVGVSWNPLSWTTGNDESWSKMSDGATPSRMRTARVQDAAYLEGSVYGQPEGLAIGVTLHGLDDTCQWQGPRRWAPQAANRLGSWKQTTTELQDPHEARGVGVIVKALVQQNAGASLFLRTIVVCAAALLCCVHSVHVVLGERRL
ncbi:hypothetical protein OG21DRAFT_824567 [Imleria badia]|nr:hypothetical protein OG21DRAFT_824567 [Imleria badia]